MYTLVLCPVGQQSLHVYGIGHVGVSEIRILQSVS